VLTEKGVEYEFRLAGQNEIGFGQEAVKTYRTPEGPPSGPPVNVTHHFQTPDTVSVSWSPPTREHRNGPITHYHIKFQKKDDRSSIQEHNVTLTKFVFTELEEKSSYVFVVCAHTSRGAGPYSEPLVIQTQRDVVRAPRNVQAVATSDQSVEVWWEAVTHRSVIGYQVGEAR